MEWPLLWERLCDMDSLTSILIYSYTHILIYSHILIHSYTHILICSYTHVLIYSYNHTLIYSYTHILIYSYTHILIYAYDNDSCLSHLSVLWVVRMILVVVYITFFNVYTYTTTLDCINTVWISIALLWCMSE